MHTPSVQCKQKLENSASTTSLDGHRCCYLLAWKAVCLRGSCHQQYLLELVRSFLLAWQREQISLICNVHSERSNE
ncbi:hypothetical protein T4D_8370 [Trichinella pseudospiralis]|uniref:Uncharacterized protein n=1 Tax=Trichinella pseudospiralis TaxID=6337 RepID=A0A0V1F9V4_TRIPS|nr:hypothetical protein T4D_8370 [Trichinella pseudospiralis]